MSTVPAPAPVPTESLTGFRLLKRRVGSALSFMRSTYHDLRENGYLSPGEAVGRWLRHPGVRSHRLSADELAATRKTSDTLFIICSGPSVTAITPEQWKEIEKHDSFGINFSYFLPHVPTYHIFSWERDANARSTLVGCFQKYRESYRKPVIMVNSRVYIRGAHPRIYPEFFPVEPTYCVYWIPEFIALESNRPFCDADFDQTLFYRSTSSHVIELAVNMLGYRKVVLLGVNLETAGHFYEDFPEVAAIKPVIDQLKATNKVLYPMIPMGNKYHPFDVYLFALAEYLKRKRGVELMVQDSTNSLHPRLPAFFS